MLLQRHTPNDLPDWIGSLFKWGFLVVVFIAPIVKSLIQTLAQRRAAAKKASEEPEGKGRAAWDDLLAGRGAPAPVSRVPAPRPPPIQAEEEDDEEEDEEDESLSDSTPPAFGELPSSSVPPLPAGVQDEEDLAEEEVAGRDRAEAQRQVQVAAAEYKASSPYRKKVEPRPASAVAPAPGPAPAPRGPAERWFGPAATARDRRDVLVRAIVLREVLGPPVALRRVEEPWSATG